MGDLNLDVAKQSTNIYQLSYQSSSVMKHTSENIYPISKTGTKQKHLYVTK